MPSFFDNSTIRLIGPHLPEGRYLDLRDCMNYMQSCARDTNEVSEHQLLQYLSMLMRDNYFQAFCEVTKIYPAEPEIEFCEVTEVIAYEIEPKEHFHLDLKKNSVWQDGREGNLRILFSHFITGWKLFKDYYCQGTSVFTDTPSTHLPGDNKLSLDLAVKRAEIIAYALKVIEVRGAVSIQLDKENMPGTRKEFLYLLNKLSKDQFGALGDRTFARLLQAHNIKFGTGGRAGQGKLVWAKLFPEHY